MNASHPGIHDRVRGLYAITPDNAATSELISKVRAALAGGARMLQYRNKSRDKQLRLEQAQALLALCQAAGAVFIVNDDLALALKVGADGLHLGKDDGDIVAARKALGPGRLLGASCYNRLTLAREALRQGADHVAFGAMFVSPTKPAANRAPLDLLFEARRQLDAPVVAIGGITMENAPKVFAAGANAIAVVSDLFDAPQIEERAREFASIYGLWVRPSPNAATPRRSSHDPRVANVSSYEPSTDLSFQPMKNSRNQELFDRALKSIPGGVNSPVRAFRAVGGTPRFFVAGAGARVWDADNREYIDYVCSWGPLVMGHAFGPAVEAVALSAIDGLSFGAPTEIEVEMAELLRQCVPSMDMVRLVSSGTEATMSALRLARGFTGRDLIVKFEGCYHGHADSLLVKAGSGALTLGQPSSGGVPAETAKHTLVLDYNDSAALEQCFREQGDRIAAVIVEPVAGNMNLVAPRPGFLEAARALCSKHGAVLIFDEVMTGFRVAPGGAQAKYGITPDLTTLGKVIGGGMPVGAFGGRRDIMEKIAPLGPVYQAGTLSGNPVALAAGMATLNALLKPGVFDGIAAAAKTLTEGLTQLAAREGVTFCAQSIGSMIGLYFRSSPPASFAEVMQCDKDRFNRFFHAMLDEGVYLAPSAYEAGFVSAAHGKSEIDATLKAAAKAFALVK